MKNGNMIMDMTQISSIDKEQIIDTKMQMKERDSNMELLRCIAMFLVVLVHTGFLSLGLPTQEEAAHTSISVFLRFLTQSVSVVCVNVFVLLSGWYGIRFSIKRLGSFLFQVFFFSFLIYVCLVIIHPADYLNVRSLSRLFILNGEDYWFVKSYLLLFLFAPFLNTLVEREESKQTVKSVLIVFFLFQTIYGWLSIKGVTELEGGYSALSFMGLYLLVRYLRCYGYDTSKYSGKIYISIFCGITFINASLAFFLARINLMIFGRIFTYTDPLVICQSLLLVFAFSQFKVKSKLINWLAISCFAVYLTHANEFILRPYYGRWIKFLFDEQNSIVFIFAVACTILAIFFLSVLIDKVRIYAWTKIAGK